MDESSKPPDPGRETLLDLVLRRMEEDRAFVHSRFLSDLLAKPEDVLQTTLTYLVALFDISANWNNFLIADYQAVDLFYKPLLQNLINNLGAEGRRRTAALDPPEQDRFILTLNAHLSARRSHWVSAALQRVRKFNAERPPSAGSSSPAPVLPEPPAETTSRRLDVAADYQGISHEEQAAQIGISRTAYFEVKAGRGGKKSRRKTETYLSNVFNKMNHESGLNRD
ncbi:MAG: hypothetical protein ABSH47_07265 [Bryobacteraceae bacterium]|jgi:hypothetical protein